MAIVELDFVTDADVLVADAVTYLQSVIPGWVPADGNLEVWLLAAHARINAELAALAGNVPDAVLRAFGTKIVSLPPIQGVAATMPTTWTATDTLGHTIPAGTQVGYRISGDTLIAFATTVDAAIPPGSATLSGVVLSGVGVGTAWNGVPAGPLELVDALSWVSSIAATATSSGGADAETDAAYSARLVGEFRLFSPRPILPGDFSVLAQNVAGVTRCLTIDGHDPGTDEKQQVAITGSPTGGSFTLTYSGQTTSALSVATPLTAGTVQTALIALSNIGPSDVVCTGGPLPATPIVVEFTGALGVQNVTTMTKTDSFTGGSSPATVITTPTPGVAPSSGNARMVCVVPVDVAGAAVSPTLRAQVQAYLDARREVTFVVNATIPTSTTINVAYTVHVAPSFDSTAVVAACTAAVTAYLAPAGWDGGTATPPTWDGETTVRYNAVLAVLSQVPGVAYVVSLTVNTGTVDVVMSGVAPMPAVGTVSGSAV